MFLRVIERVKHKLFSLNPRTHFNDQVLLKPGKEHATVDIPDVWYPSLIPNPMHHSNYRIPH